ncbi:hypothetical protein BDR26DRAFT_859633, partial [Obelidium mucronatum]
MRIKRATDPSLPTKDGNSARQGRFAPRPQICPGLQSKKPLDFYLLPVHQTPYLGGSFKGKERASEVQKTDETISEVSCEIEDHHPVSCFPVASLPIPVIYELVDIIFQASQVDICAAVNLFQSCTLFRQYGFKILAKRLLSHLPKGIHDVEITLPKEHLEQFNQIPDSFGLEWKVGSIVTKILKTYFRLYDQLYETFKEVAKHRRWDRTREQEWIILSQNGTIRSLPDKLVSWSQLYSLSEEFNAASKRIREANPVTGKNGEVRDVLLPLDCALFFRWLKPNLEVLGKFGFFDRFQPLYEGIFALAIRHFPNYEFKPEHAYSKDYMGVWYGDNENPKKEGFINFGYNFGSMIYTRLYVNTSSGGNAATETYGVVSAMYTYEGWTGLNRAGDFESTTSMLMDILKQAEDPEYDNDKGWPVIPHKLPIWDNDGDEFGRG